MQKVHRLLSMILAVTLVFSLTLVASAQDDVTPSVTARSQMITDGTVTIAEVVAAQDGWIVIHAQSEEGGIGPVIGHAPVSAGVNEDVTVEVDLAATTDHLYAMLHADEGEVGTYEFPGPDGPVSVDGEVVAPIFNVVVAGGSPRAEAINEERAAEAAAAAEAEAEAEEETAEEETAEEETAEEETAEEETAEEETAEEETAEEETAEEETAEEETAEEETAEEETAEEGEEAADDGEVTAEDFTPSVSVRDQVLQVIGEQQTVSVPQLFATEDGWIVIHRDDEGAPGEVIGQAFVEAGPHFEVEVPLDATLTEDQSLWAMLHVDAGELGTYEFPGPDGPVTLDDEVVMAQFAILVPTVVVEDQQTTDGAVTIEGVATAADGWMVIHRSSEEGGPGEVIGFAPVAPGVTPDVVVELSADVSDGEQLWAMLHYDLGVKGEYEFPGDDVPVRLADSVVMSSFTVNAEMMEEEATEEEEMADEDMADEDMADEEMDDEDMGEEEMAETPEEGDAPEMLPVTGGSLSEQSNQTLPWVAGLSLLVLAVGAFIYRRRTT